MNLEVKDGNPSLTRYFDQSVATNIHITGCKIRGGSSVEEINMSDHQTAATDLLTSKVDATAKDNNKRDISSCDKKKRKSKSKGQGFYLGATSEGKIQEKAAPGELVEGSSQEETEDFSRSKSKRSSEVSSSGNKLDEHFAQEDPRKKSLGTTIATDPTAPLSPTESTSSLQKSGAMGFSSRLLDIAASPPPPGSSSPGWRIRESYKKSEIAITSTPIKSTGQRKRILRNSDTSPQLPNALQMAAAFSPMSPRKLRVVKKLEKTECRLRRRSNSADREVLGEEVRKSIEQEIEEELKNSKPHAAQRPKSARRKKPPAVETIEPAKRKSESDKRAPHNRSGVAHHKSERADDLLLDRNSQTMVDRVPSTVSWHSRKQNDPSTDDDGISVSSFHSTLTPSVQSKELQHDDSSQESSTEDIEISLDEKISSFLSPDSLPKKTRLQPRARPSDSSPAVPRRFQSGDAMLDIDDDEANSPLQVPKIVPSKFVAATAAPSDEESDEEEYDAELQDSLPHKQLKDLSPMKPVKMQSAGTLQTSRSEEDPSNLKDLSPTKPVKKQSAGTLQTRRNEEDPSNLQANQDTEDQHQETAPPAAPAMSPSSSKRTERTRGSNDSAALSKRKVSKEKEDEKKARSAAASEILKHKISQMNELRLKTSSAHSGSVSVTSTPSVQDVNFEKGEGPRRMKSAEGPAIKESKRRIRKEKSEGQVGLDKKLKRNGSRKDILKKEGSKRSVTSQSGEEEKSIAKERGRKKSTHGVSSDPLIDDTKKKTREKTEGSLLLSSSHSKSSRSSRSKSVGRRASSEHKKDRKARSRSQSPNGKGKRQPKSLVQPEKLAPWQIMQHRVVPVASLYNVKLDDDDDEEDPNLPPAFRNKTKKVKKVDKQNKAQAQGQTDLSLEREKRRSLVIEALGKFSKETDNLPPAFRHLGSKSTRI
jgi:hypothetical protein